MWITVDRVTEGRKIYIRYESISLVQNLNKRVYVTVIGAEEDLGPWDKEMAESFLDQFERCVAVEAQLKGGA